MAEFPKQYNPKEAEAEAQNLWENEKIYLPKPSKTGDTFYIPIPPPNVTGNLHLGHALTLTLQDIMIRYHRMKGDETVWIPGTDHAGIATQAQVEKRLESQGTSRQEIGRERFLEECWKWMEEFSGNIQNQIKKIGASVDWSKERFTFDDKSNDLVEKTFIDLYNKGLIYRGEYMVNYSPKLESAISDIEVEYEEINERMYYINYFVSGSDATIQVATTRPETLLADQAVAVHPDDKRYKRYIGRNLILPITNKEIPLIADETVDMEFGTGAVKITPAHDPSDFEMGKRHHLRTDYTVIDKNGVMNAEAGPFAGLAAAGEARDNVVELLKSKGNLVKVEPYTHKVGFCSRWKCRIESVVSTQWFVKIDPIAKKVIDGYEKWEFTIIPGRFKKQFEKWIYNLKDWCISRQLWWGHQIPAYYNKATGELIGVTQDPTDLYKKYGKENVIRDNDVLDTWFSSGLWPFSILDWDFDTPAELFEKFYPADVLETGNDLIFFWVIRMLLLGYEFTGQTPFEKIYFHGMILDEHGKKMSKSWGNVVDPLDVIEQYSTDALRLAVVLGNTPGNNMNFSIKNVEEYSLFLNKLWNIARFSWMNVGNITENKAALTKKIQENMKDLLSHEKWILSKLAHISKEVTESMESYNFSLTWLDLIAFIRDDFADFFIETYKIKKADSQLWDSVLSLVILEILTLIHPYIPHITESLYGYMTQWDILASNQWTQENWKSDVNIENQIEKVQDIIRTIRNIRAEKKIKPSDLRDVWIVAVWKDKTMIEENKDIIQWLAKIDTLHIEKPKENKDLLSYAVVVDIDIYVDAQIDESAQAEEIKRLKEQIEDKKVYLRTIEKKLSNPAFSANAPQEIVRSEMEKKNQATLQLKKLEEKLEKLG